MRIAIMNESDKNNILVQLLTDLKKKLTIIFILQTLLILFALLTLVIFNIFQFTGLGIGNKVILNSALFGYLGSLVFFSRKSYVYLITKKFLNIINAYDISIPSNVHTIDSIIRGYYLYLFFRPLVGLIIGPILYMISLTGLITFMEKSIDLKIQISQSGRYFIYIISFLGGHASSDVLDRFSKVAQKIVLNSSKDIEPNL